MRKRTEEYQNMISRLFPNSDKTVRSVTLQVTDSCNLCCVYCLTAGTQILLPDFTTKNIEDIAVGDKVLAFPEFPRKTKHNVFEVAEVTALFKRQSHVLRITLDNGASIDVTEEHPILSRRNTYDCRYDYVEAGKLRVGQSVYCAPDVVFDPPKIDDNYRIGYLLGIIMGDGLLKRYKIEKWENSWVYKFRLALKDTEATCRAKEYLDYFGIDTYMKPFKISTKYNLSEDSIFSCAKSTYNVLTTMIAENFRVNKSESYFRGYLAGIYDAEGHISSGGTIRICNTNRDIIDEIVDGLNLINVDYVVEETSGTKNKSSKWNVRVLTRGKNADNNLHHNMDFIMKVSPAISRKGFDAFIGRSLLRRAKVVSIERLDEVVEVYNFETTTHTYFANRVAVHNCYQHNKGKHFLDFETAKKFIDTLLAGKNEYINFENTEGIILDFIGGEPLLAIDLIEQITEYTITKMSQENHPWQFRFRVSICSNGVLYFNEKVQNFLKKYDPYVSFSVSIDGNKELHDSCRVFPDGSGSYDMAIAAAKHYRANFHDIGTKMTLAPDNVAYTSEALQNLIHEGYTQIFCNCVFEEGWQTEHAVILYQQLKNFADYLFENNLHDEIYVSIFEEGMFEPMTLDDNQNYCGGNGEMIAVDWKGDIYPCLRYMESSVGGNAPPIIIGTVDGGIAVTPEQKHCVDCLQCMTRCSQSTEECIHCPIAKGCAWCSAYNYEYWGELNKRCTFICPMHKARALANVYFWNKYYRALDKDARMECHVPREWALNIVSEDEYEMLLELTK